MHGAESPLVCGGLAISGPLVVAAARQTPRMLEMYIIYPPCYTVLLFVRFHIRQPGHG